MQLRKIKTERELVEALYRQRLGVSPRLQEYEDYQAETLADELDAEPTPDLAAISIAASASKLPRVEYNRRLSLVRMSWALDFCPRKVLRPVAVPKHPLVVGPTWFKAGNRYDLNAAASYVGGLDFSLSDSEYQAYAAETRFSELQPVIEVDKTTAKLVSFLFIKAFVAAVKRHTGFVYPDGWNPLIPENMGVVLYFHDFIAWFLSLKLLFPYFWVDSRVSQRIAFRKTALRDFGYPNHSNFISTVYHTAAHTLTSPDVARKFQASCCIYRNGMQGKYDVCYAAKLLPRQVELEESLVTLMSRFNVMEIQSLEDAVRQASEPTTWAMLSRIRELPHLIEAERAAFFDKFDERFRRNFWLWPDTAIMFGEK